jgi:hypothetical protein
MRDCSLWRLAPAFSAFTFIVTSAAWAAAQTAPAPAAPTAVAPQPAPAPAPLAAPPPAPPGAYPPPAAYPGYPPPPAYPNYPAPPPGYAYAYPTPPRAPESVSYEGGPVPAGYHVEERARRGAVIAGAVIVSSSYALGLTVASSENFPNSTGYLALPVFGPWITLASRHRATSCTDTNTLGDCSDFDSSDDATTRTFLLLDGLAQATGAVLFIYGLASPKKVVTRDFVGSLHLTPSMVGRNAYGGFLTGSF